MSKPLRIINDPDGRTSALFERIKRARTVRFVLCIGGTKTSDIEGLSAAGATPQDRRLTPKCDAEALISGLKRGVNGNTISLPVSPEGIVSPVVITVACLKLLDVPVTIVDCGSFASPVIGDRRNMGLPPANCLSTGRAQEAGNVENLFERGLELGREFSTDSELIVVSECVPAGTSTALAVLTGLGYDVLNSVSSSMPDLDQDLRRKLVTSGLEKAGMLPLVQPGDPDSTQEKIGPLKLVSAVGDPMQPFAAGLALGASASAAVVLGGGSQMLAVYSLIKACTARGSSSNYDLSKIGAITTSWVVFDRNARVADIARTLAAPFSCSMLNFRQSKHNGLRAYEDGHVKEGVGAGASIVLAHLRKGLTETELIEAIDESYSQMVGSLI